MINFDFVHKFVFTIGFILRLMIIFLDKIIVNNFSFLENFISVIVLSIIYEDILLL